MDKDFTNEYIEIMDTFYHLKNQYQESFRNKYVQPIVKSKGSKIEKRKKYINLPKPKCVNCKRNVGTLFKIEKLGLDKGKNYSVKCGDEKEPCPLLVIFTIPNTININNELEVLNENSLVNSLKEDKNLIIELKNNAMFGFLTKEDMIFKFKELNIQIQETSEIYDTYLTLYIEKTMPPEKEAELKKIKEEFEINKQIFQEYIDEYKSSTQNKVITNAIEFYISSLLPLSKKISELSYSYRFMQEKEPNIFYLQLKKFSIAQMEVYYGNFKIEQNKVGMLSTSKTIKKTTNIKSKKTKKNKKQLLIQDSEDNIPAEIITEEPTEEDIEQKNTNLLENAIDDKNSNINNEENIDKIDGEIDQELKEEFSEGIEQSDSLDKSDGTDDIDNIDQPEGEIDWGDSSGEEASSILKNDIVSLDKDKEESS